MSTLWGPALDAEISYRRERLTAHARRRGRADAAGQAADAATPVVAVPVAAAPATAAPVVRAAVTAAARGGVPAARRGWRLRGSGAWHAAR
ncbi:hypothetical protein [Cellulomonas oligotrophica]|nr:hypothetical protein [Cellulomonas oligotrophica]NYD87090.1 hypothetical protein [Cellulomonas oligotrophica]